MLWPLILVTIELTTAAPTPYEPIPLKTKPEPDPTPLDVSKPGTTSAKSERSYIWSAVSWSAVIAVIETAISWVDSSFLVAVTTTSSTSCVKAENEKENVTNVKNNLLLIFVLNMNIPQCLILFCIFYA